MIRRLHCYHLSPSKFSKGKEIIKAIALNNGYKINVNIIIKNKPKMLLLFSYIIYLVPVNTPYYILKKEIQMSACRPCQ